MEEKIVENILLVWAHAIWGDEFPSLFEGK
jgi:hypothetical protein